MPFTYEIIPERRLAIIRVTGRVVDGTMVEVADAVAQDPAWSPSYARLVDGTGITDYDVSLEGEQRLIEAVRTGRGRARKVAVVHASELRRASVELTAAYLRYDYPVRAFFDLDEALAWLEDE